MSHVPKVLNALSRLLSYPDEHTVQTAEFVYVILQGEIPEASQAALEFGAFAERHELQRRACHHRTLKFGPHRRL